MLAQRNNARTTARRVFFFLRRGRRVNRSGPFPEDLLSRLRIGRSPSSAVTRDLLVVRESWRTGVGYSSTVVGSPSFSFSSLLLGPSRRQTTNERRTACSNPPSPSPSSPPSPSSTRSSQTLNSSQSSPPPPNNCRVTRSHCHNSGSPSLLIVVSVRPPYLALRRMMGPTSPPDGADEKSNSSRVDEPRCYG